jgi:cation diffusion facilitator CzcD-associated flavoprotein CzcO
VSREANGTVSEWVRERIADPATAEKLTPNDHAFGTKRVSLENGYYEIFNRDNVELVDVKETPIEEITPTGVRTRDGEHEFDAIGFATGFDAMTGPYNKIEIRGRGGQPLRDKWAEGVAYLPRRHERGLPQPVRRHRAAEPFGAHEHAGRDRAARRVALEPHRTHARRPRRRRTHPRGGGDVG